MSIAVISQISTVCLYAGTMTSAFGFDVREALRFFAVDADDFLLLRA
jgi:hypothetical protein